MIKEFRNTRVHEGGGQNIVLGLRGPPRAATAVDAKYTWLPGQKRMIRVDPVVPTVTTRGDRLNAAVRLARVNNGV